MGKRVHIILAISLLLNLLLAGVVAGRWMRGEHSAEQLRTEREARREEIIAALPEERRSLFRLAVNAMQEQRKHYSERTDQLRQEMIEILTAPEFDAAAYAAKADELAKQQATARQYMFDASKELAQQLNQQERVALAEYLRRKPSAGGKDGGGKTK